MILKYIDLKRLFPLFLLIALCLLIPALFSSTYAQEDHHSLVAFSANGAIHVMNPDGSAITRIGPERPQNDRLAGDRSPSWSSDGQEIVFASFRTGIGQISIMDADGSNPVMITDDHFDDSLFPSWSPDSRYIAYTYGGYQTHINDRGDIIVIERDGSNPVNITHSPRVEDADPEWSPDSSFVIYASEQNGNFDLYLASRDGSNVRQLTSTSLDERYPEWSPDGTRIVYSGGDLELITCCYEGTLPLYVMNADGSNPIQITFPDDSVQDISASWSPDSQSLAFCRIYDGRAAGIFTVRVDGSELNEILSAEQLRNGCDPSWSPWLPGPAPTGEPPSTPTLTPPPATLTPSTLECAEAPPSQLNVGMQVLVTAELGEDGERRNLRVRESPGGEPVGLLEPLDTFYIIGEAVCGEDGLRWWPIQTTDGQLQGWSVEGFAPDDYLMIPMAS